MTMKSRLAAAALVVSMAVLAACSGEVVGGGQKPVETRATSGGGGGSPLRAPGAEPAFSRTAAGGARSYSAAFATAQASGTIDFDARVTLVDAAGGQEPATPGTASAHLAIGQGDSTLVAREQVAAVRYVRARVAFTRVHTTVTGGLTLGGGSFTGALDVPIAAGDSLVVEAPVAMASASQPYTLVVDLGAATWLAAAEAGTHVVPPAIFRAAVSLRTR
jgi:hypothetical protein